MAERNWRDEFEPKDKLDRKVTDVIYHNGSPWGYMIYTVAMGDFPSTDVHRLIPKPKPKTYRPWKDDEVPVGAVVVAKDTSDKGIITTCRPGSGFPITCSIGGEWRAVRFFEKFTMLDGSPAGVLES